MALDIHSLLLYRDALMLVLNKPSGLPVHKGTGGGETFDQHFEELRFGLPRVPSLAHRLDRGTSGCLVLGRHRKALDKLGKMFASGRIEKTYWAVVSGQPAEESGVIDLPLARQSDNPARWWMKVAGEGDEAQPALTRYRVMGTQAGHSWLELEPQTGRTHQLRVHCAAIGCPIIGDTAYGGQAGSMMCLHARAVSVPLYASKPPIVVTAPTPQHLLPFGYFR